MVRVDIGRGMTCEPVDFLWVLGAIVVVVRHGWIVGVLVNSESGVLLGRGFLW